MVHYTGRVIESQADWLTVSAHGQASARALADLAVGLQKEEATRGNRLKKWRSMGYEGLACGRVQYGQRDVSATELRLSGDAAAQYLDAAIELADGVTRIDLAVTWQADEPASLLGKREAIRAKRFHQMRAGSAAPWHVSDADGGSTLYIGQRRSENFFRLYNKEAQERRQLGKLYDGRYDRCWRYELELKASGAWGMRKEIVKHTDRAAFVQSYVHAYCSAHGLEPPFDPLGGQALVPGFRRASDEQTKLLHLERNVRPTVRWLLERGRGDELRQALGLS